MDDEFAFIVLGITFFLGVILLLSGFADLSVAINPDTWLSDFLKAVRAGGTGALKIFVGLILTGFVVAPGAVKVIFQR
ncbi:hypothetical protein ES703_53198 [subsurface metagenome]